MPPALRVAWSDNGGVGSDSGCAVEGAAGGRLGAALPGGSCWLVGGVSETWGHWASVRST